MTPQETIAHLQSQLDECRKERAEARERLLRESEMNHGLSRALTVSKRGNGATAEAQAIESESIFRFENHDLRTALAAECESLRAVRKERDALRATVAKMRDCMANARVDLLQIPNAYKAFNRLLEEGLAISPKDLADCVCVKRSEWEARQILPVSLDHSDAVPLRRAFILVLSGLSGKLAGKNFGSDKTSGEHLVWMIGECLLNIRTMQIDKLSRWVGFIQGVLAANGLLDVDEERERTRPLFHKAYAELTALRSQGDKL